MTDPLEIPPIETRSLAHWNPVNAKEYQNEAAFAAARFAYLVEKRDQLQDKLRFGLLALNGGSLVALLGALSGDGQAASWFGFTVENAKYSAALFASGIVAAGASAITQSNLFTKEAGDANSRRLAASWLASFHEADANDKNWDTLKTLLDDFSKAPLVDFQYSVAAIVLQNLAGSAWLAGILYPLCGVLF